MNLTSRTSRQRQCRGTTLVEFAVATGIGTAIALAAGLLTMYAARASAGIYNYVNLDNNSRITMDLVSRSLREATAVVNCQTNGSQVVLTLTNANASTTQTLTYDRSAQTLIYAATGQSNQTLLTQCNSWMAQCYNRVPLLSSTNINFYAATNGSGQFDPTSVKLINMVWKCYRNILGSPINTESVQTAQVVLRNKTE